MESMTEKSKRAVAVYRIVLVLWTFHRLTLTVMDRCTLTPQRLFITRSVV